MKALEKTRPGWSNRLFTSLLNIRIVKDAHAPASRTHQSGFFRRMSSSLHSCKCSSRGTEVLKEPEFKFHLLVH